jgi:subtilisin family serine protease
LVRARETWELGYTGAGSVVAIIDGEGFEASHPDFAGKVLLEVCASATDEMCPNGQDVEEGPGMAANLPGGPHGTAMAGVIHQFAPDAEFIFISVMGSTVDEGGPIRRAYEWVVDNADRFGIDALSMSYGSWWYPRGDGCRSTQGESTTFPAMRELGVVPVAAAGNDGLFDRVKAPACQSAAVSVGMVNVTGVVAPMSNVSKELTFLAPTNVMAATISENGVYASSGGTSAAAPVIAAMIAIGRQIAPGATVDELIEAGRSSAVSIDDIEVTDLRLVDFLAFAQTLAGLPVSPRGPLYEIDAVTSVSTGFKIGFRELHSVGGFIFSWGGTISDELVRVSGDDSICTTFSGGVVAVGPGTCIYSLSMAPTDLSTGVISAWESKIIQINVS